MGLDSVAEVVQFECAMLYIALLAVMAPVWAGAPAQEAEGWDFVPGEKLLLYDDFTDMRPGGQPPHWKVRKSVVKLSATGRMVAEKDVVLTPNVRQWPANFTIEQEFSIDKAASEPVLTWYFGKQEEGHDWRVRISFVEDGTCTADAAGDDELARAPCQWDSSKPQRVSVWMQEGRLRLYLNAQPLFDVNQVKAAAGKEAWLDLRTSEGAVQFASFRIAESAPDLSKTMFATGRFVTHGTHFDTNSDRVKAESGPVLKMVAEALKADPAMRLRIEGHTDSTGDAAKNMDLSARRAASVKGELVKYGIDAGRLETAGLGASKPSADNATPVGRAENRRVEFVKM